MQNICRQPRILFIDILRGFTMLLVVYAHIDVFLLSNVQNGEPSVLNIIFGIVRMPMFFFVMGFFLYSENYNLKLLKKRMLNRLVKQLYPTIVIFIVFVVSILGLSVRSQVLEVYKSGYWFTFVAVEYFFTIAPLFYLFSRFNVSKIWRLVILLCFIFLVKLLYHFFRETPWIVESSPSKIFSAALYLRYITYVLFGCVFRMFWDSISQKLLKLNGLFCGCVLFGIGIFLNVPFLSFHILPIIGIYVLLTAAFLLPDRFIGSNTGKALTYVGTYTLEVYLLHYFIIYALIGFSLPVEYLLFFKNTIIEFPAFMLLSCIITAACILLIRILRFVKLYPLLFPNVNSMKFGA